VRPREAHRRGVKHIGTHQTHVGHVAGVRTSSYEVTKSGVVAGHVLRTAGIVLRA
jgi:hypothetical protein